MSVCVCTSCSVSVRWAVGFFRGVFSSSVDVLAPRFAVLRHLAPFLEVRWQARAFERLIQRVGARTCIEVARAAADEPPTK